MPRLTSLRSLTHPRHISRLVMLMTVVCHAWAAHALAQWEVVDLGTTFTPYAINHAYIVGFHFDGTTAHPAAYHVPTGTSVRLSTAPGHILGLSEHHHAVGRRYVQQGSIPWNWGMDAPLMVDGTSHSGYATSANRDGIACGTVVIRPPLLTRAVWWNLHIPNHSAFLDPSDGPSWCQAVNHHHMFTGGRRLMTNGKLGEMRATLWRHGQAIDMHPAGAEASIGKVLSDGIGPEQQVLVMGDAFLAGGRTRAFAWAQALGPIMLPLLPRYTESQVSAMNHALLAVGHHYAPHDGIRPYAAATVWLSGEPWDLNLLVPANSGWHLESATGINEQTMIVGMGTLHGDTRGYLLRPAQALAQRE